MPAVVWDGVSQIRGFCQPGQVVFVNGRYNVHPRFGPQLTIQGLRGAQDPEYARDELLDGPRGRQTRWKLICENCWAPSTTRTCIAC